MRYVPKMFPAHCRIEEKRLHELYEEQAKETSPIKSARIGMEIINEKERIEENVSM